MAKPKIQHFIGKNFASADKDLITETVKEGSESARFLKNLGRSSKEKPCFKIIDMRNKAPGPYRSVKYKGITFYLDDYSYLIYDQGLKEHDGTLTMGTYEEIISGPHTYIGQNANDSKERAKLILTGGPTVREAITDEKEPAEIMGSYAPAILHLGYFCKRRDQRLLYVMPITMHYEGKDYEVKSKDVSVGGLKMFLPRTLIIPGRMVQLSFDFFINEQNKTTEPKNARFFEKVNYKIVDVQHLGEKTYVSAIQRDLSDFAREYIGKFIRLYKVQYKLDSSDIYTAARARLLEHVYTHNLASIPMFINRGNQGLHIDAIIQTSKNKKLLSFFQKSQYVYDFRTFMVPARVSHLADIAYDNGTVLMFCYWDKDQLFSICDFELTDQSDLAQIILKVISKRGRIFSLNCKLFKEPAAQKINSIIGLLINLEENLAKQVRTTAEEYYAQVMLTDITSVLRNESYFSLYFSELQNKDSRVNIWRGHEKVTFNSGTVIDSFDLENTPKPRRIVFDVQKNRTNVRYMHKMEVNLLIKDSIISGHTVDFSRDGIGMEIKPSNLISKGMEVLVTFTSLAGKVNDVDLTNIPFKVVRMEMVGDDDDPTCELGLVRIKKQDNKNVGVFFSNLINRNKTKLDICVQDRVDMTMSHIMEAYIAENINTIPLFVTKDKEEGRYIKDIGMTEIACALAEHFFIKNRGYSFRILTSEERLKELYRRTLRGNLKEDQAIILYLYKGINNNGMETIYSYTSLEFNYEGEVLDVLQEVFANNGACIKIQFSNNLEMSNQEIEAAVDMVKSINVAQSNRIKHDITEILGLVDMVDVTQSFRTLYELQDYY